jgi:hypothetical protein
MRDFRVFPDWRRYFLANLTGIILTFLLYWRRVAAGQNLSVIAPLAVIGVWVAGTTVVYVILPVARAWVRRRKNTGAR